mgnify:CR=1 FL=1
MVEPVDLQAFQKNRLGGNVRVPVILVGFGVILLGTFFWFFSGYSNQRKAIFGEPKIFDVQVDGAGVSQNNHPDIVNSVVMVPLGKPFEVSCESTFRVIDVRFEAHLGEQVVPADQCKFSFTAPTALHAKLPVKLVMIARKDGAILDEESIEVSATNNEAWAQVTHLVDAVKNEPLDGGGLYVPPEARVIGKVFLPEEPPEAADLRVALLIGLPDVPDSFLVAVDSAAKEKGQVVPVFGTLAPYRHFGDAGRGYYFQSNGPVAFGKKGDVNQVFKAVAVVLKKGELEGLANRSWEIVPGVGETPGKLKPRGLTLAEAKVIAWKGLISDDIRLVRLAPGQAAPHPVKWRKG